MADVPGLLRDLEFNKLDMPTQKATLGRLDPDFANISDDDYTAFRQKLGVNGGGGNTGQLAKNQAVIDAREKQSAGPEGSAVSRFGKSLYDSTIGAVPEALRTVGSIPLSVIPGETGREARSTLYRNIVQPQVDQFKQAGQAGMSLEGAGHALAGALPFVGPQAAHIGEQLGSGDVAGGLGSATGMAAQAGAAKIAPNVVQGIADVAPNIPPVMKGAVKGMWDARKDILKGATGGAVAGHYMGVGGEPGAIVGGGIPLVQGAIKGGRAALNPPPIEQFPGQFTEQPIAAKGPPPVAPPDKFGSFTPPSGLLPKPVPEAPVPDKFGNFTPPKGLLPKEVPPPPVPDKFGSFTPPRGLAPGPAAPPPDPWGKFTPPGNLLPKPIEMVDKFGKFTPQPVAKPGGGPPPPIAETSSPSPTLSPAAAPATPTAPAAINTPTGSGSPGGHMIEGLDQYPDRYQEIAKQDIVRRAENSLKKDTNMAIRARDAGITPDQVSEAIAAGDTSKLHSWAKEAGYPRGMSRPQDFLNALVNLYKEGK